MRKASFGISTNRLFILLALFFIGNSATAQTGSLHGTVKTSDGASAAEVNVRLKEITKATASHNDGSFRLNNIPQGSYTLVISFVGLQTIEKPVNIIAGEIKHLQFTLVENKTQLEEIVVKAGRSVNEKPVAIGKVAIASRDLPQSMF